MNSRQIATLELGSAIQECATALRWLHMDGSPTVIEGEAVIKMRDAERRIRRMIQLLEAGE